MRNFETMENRIIIALTPMGAVICKISEGEVINPRLIRASKSDEQGGAGIRFSTMLGMPEVLFLGKTPYYLIEDAQLIESYEDSVNPSRLVIP